jgi:hypothetical protein
MEERMNEELVRRLLSKLADWELEDLEHLVEELNVVIEAKQAERE